MRPQNRNHLKSHRLSLKTKFSALFLPLLKVILPLSTAFASTHAQATTTNASLIAEKEKLNQRVEAVRLALEKTDSSKIEIKDSGMLAQWYNWDNWRNGWGNQWYNYR